MLSSTLDYSVIQNWKNWSRMLLLLAQITHTMWHPSSKSRPRRSNNFLECVGARAKLFLVPSIAVQVRGRVGHDANTLVYAYAYVRITRIWFHGKTFFSIYFYFKNKIRETFMTQRCINVKSTYSIVYTFTLALACVWVLTHMHVSVAIDNWLSLRTHLYLGSTSRYISIEKQLPNEYFRQEPIAAVI